MTLSARAFQLAFGDLSSEGGFALREAAQMRHFRHGDPDRFAGLLTVADLDAFLVTEAATTQRVSMADSRRQGSAGVPETLFAFDDGKLDTAKLLGLFDGGATLVVSQFHEVHRPLAEFCRGLEKAFMHAVQANIYLTPPGAKGFRVHFDTHDVLVLQVIGRKTWRVFEETPIAFATRNTPWENGMFDAEGKARETIEMVPGDVLYMPRGVPHDAAAHEGNEPSLHVTIGLFEPSWAEALKAAIDQLEPMRTRLREPFPVWRLGDETKRAALLEALAVRAGLLGGEEAMELASLTLLDQLAGERMPLIRRGLMANSPGVDDILILDDAVHHHVVPVDAGAALRWSGDAIPLDAVALVWLEKLAAGVSPRDLGGPEALEFCIKLFRLGLLRRA